MPAPRAAPNGSPVTSTFGTDISMRKALLTTGIYLGLSIALIMLIIFGRIWACSDFLFILHYPGVWLSRKLFHTADSEHISDFSIALLVSGVLLFDSVLVFGISWLLSRIHDDSKAEQDGPPNDPQRGSFRGGQA